jgi:hypothetical protein
MRKLLLALFAVGLVLSGALLALAGAWHCPVSEASSRQIKKGMTQAEVEKILGGRPGDYRTLPPDDFLPEKEFDLTDIDRGEDLLGAFPWDDRENVVITERADGVAEIRYGDQEEWLGDQGTVVVTFAIKRRHVLTVGFRPGQPKPCGLPEVVMWRLKRLKERWLP